MTDDIIVHYLTHGFAEWFGQHPGATFDVRSGGILTVNITTLTPEGKQLARWALESWSNVTGISFQEVEHDDVDIMFYDDYEDAWSDFVVVEGSIVSAEVNVSTGWLNIFGTGIDSYSFQTYIHEIGHALGLGHAGPYNGGHPDFLTQTVSFSDSWQTSVMSYISQDENVFTPASYAHVVTPMINDIAAIHELYGKPDNVNGGDTVYGYGANTGTYMDEFFRVWSGDGNPFSNINMAGERQPTFVDNDYDGDLDLYTLSPSQTIIYFYENVGTARRPDFRYSDFIYWEVRIQDYEFVDFNGDGDLDIFIFDQHNIHLIVSGHEEPVSTPHGYDNFDLGNTDFEFVDINGDNAFDMFVMTPNSFAFLINIGTPALPEFDEPVSTDGDFSFFTDYTFDDIDGDRDYDMVFAANDGSIIYMENIGSSISPTFADPVVINNPLNSAIYGDLPWNLNIQDFAFADLDNDGDLDFFAFDAGSTIFYFQNTGAPGSFHFDPTTFNNSTAITIYDTDGQDILDFRTDIQNQVINLTPASPSSVYGLEGNLVIAHDTIIESVIAGRGDDVVLGNDTNNVINGNHGDDLLIGNNGNDTVKGSAGDDLLRGDRGDDKLIGGPGADTLVGGIGNDTFVFSPNDGAHRDTIVDFRRGLDLIDLSAFDSIHSVSDITWYYHGESGEDARLDLTEHGGGEIILADYSKYGEEYIYNDDFGFSDNTTVA